MKPEMMNEDNMQSHRFTNEKGDRLRVERMGRFHKGERSQKNEQGYGNEQDKRDMRIQDSPENMKELGGNGADIGDIFEGMGGGIGGDGQVLLENFVKGVVDESGDGSTMRKNVPSTYSKAGDIGGTAVCEKTDSSKVQGDERGRKGAFEDSPPRESDSEIEKLIEEKVRDRARIHARVRQVFGPTGAAASSLRASSSGVDGRENRLIRAGRLDFSEIPPSRRIHLSPEQAEGVKGSIRQASTSSRPLGAGLDENVRVSPEAYGRGRPNITVEGSRRMEGREIFDPLPLQDNKHTNVRELNRPSPGRLPTGDPRIPSFSMVARQVSEEIYLKAQNNDFVSDTESEYDFAQAGPSSSRQSEHRWNVNIKKPQVHPMMLRMERKYGSGRTSSFDINVTRRQNMMTIPLSQTHDPFEVIRRSKGPRSNNSYSIDTRSAAEYVDDPRTISDPSIDYELTLKLKMNMRSVGRYMGPIEDESDEEDSNGLLRDGHTRKDSYIEADPTTSLAALLGPRAVSKHVIRSQGFGCSLSLERELLKVLPASTRQAHYLFIWHPLAQVWTTILPRFLACPSVDIGMGIGPELRNLILYSCCVGPVPRGTRALTDKETAAVKFARMTSCFPHRITIECRRLMDRLFGTEKMQQIALVIALGGFWNTVMGLLGLDSTKPEPEAVRKAQEGISFVADQTDHKSKVLSKRKKGLLHRFKFPIKAISYTRQITRLESAWLDSYPSSWRRIEQMLKPVMGFIPEYLMRIRSVDQRRTLTCAIEQVLLTENKKNNVSLPLKHMMMYVMAVAAENPVLAAHSAYLASRFGADVDQLVRATNRGLLQKLRKIKVEYEDRQAKGDLKPPGNTTMQALTLFTRKELAALLLAHSAATTGRRSSLETLNGIHAPGKFHLTSRETEALLSDFIPEGIMEAVGVIAVFSMLQRWTAVFHYRGGALEPQIRQFVQGPIGFELSLSSVGQRKPSRMDSDFGNHSMSSRRLASYLPRRMMTK